MNQPDILEVNCSAISLGAASVLLSLTLYWTNDGEVLATLNTVDSACYTFTTYTSCHVGSTDTKMSYVKALLVKENSVDIEDTIGCNLTIMERNRLGPIYSTLSWTVPIRFRSW